MNRYLYYFVPLLILASLTACQSNMPVVDGQLKKSVSHGDTLHLFQVLNTQKTFKTRDNKVYYGFRFGEIQQTQGAITGYPLSGDYEMLHFKKPLVKGSFKDGLKSGLWYEWDGAGVLRSVKSYRNGLYDGLSKTFDEEGKLITFQQYKNDLRQGIGLYQNSSGPYYLKYKNDLVMDTLLTLNKAQQIKYGLLSVDE